MATLQGNLAKASTRNAPRRGYQLSGEERLAWLLVSLRIIGFAAFQLGPMLASLGLTLAEWRIFTPPKFIGLAGREIPTTFCTRCPECPLYHPCGQKASVHRSPRIPCELAQWELPWIR